MPSKPYGPSIPKQPLPVPLPPPPQPSPYAPHNRLPPLPPAAPHLRLPPSCARAPALCPMHNRRLKRLVLPPLTPLPCHSRPPTCTGSMTCPAGPSPPKVAVADVLLYSSAPRAPRVTTTRAHDPATSSSRPRSHESVSTSDKNRETAGDRPAWSSRGAGEGQGRLWLGGQASLLAS